MEGKRSKGVTSREGTGGRSRRDVREVSYRSHLVTILGRRSRWIGQHEEGEEQDGVEIGSAIDFGDPRGVSEEGRGREEQVEAAEGVSG
jgi:hypothetical protein